jgi:hypothetical protein
MEGFDRDDGPGAAKRPGDDDTAEGSKRFKMDTVTVDLMVPGVTVATVIGKSGAHVKVIEQSSGTRISFAKVSVPLASPPLPLITPLYLRSRSTLKKRVLGGLSCLLDGA